MRSAATLEAGGSPSSTRSSDSFVVSGSPFGVGEGVGLFRDDMGGGGGGGRLVPELDLRLEDDDTERSP